ncbi:MAG: Tn3 family transposase [Cyanobacteria bacterium J06631_2]
MPTVAETAYPRLKNQIREKELTEIYTPTLEELNLASQYTRKGATKLGFLVLLKTFQRLGYFVAPTTIPNAIVKHIAHSAALACPPNVLKSYDTSGTRWRHITIIRDYLSINPYQAKARKLIVKSMAEAARTKNDLADIINVAIEELVHHRYELPVFNTLVRAAKRVRVTVDRSFYRQVRQSFNYENYKQLDSLFTTTEPNSKTPWLELKQDPGKPILKNLKALVWRLKWLSQLNTYQDALEHIPNVKLKHFATEAMSLDAARMKELEPNKRYTLAAALIATQSARTLDDLATMFIRRMQKIHVKAKEALNKYREEYQARTDRLIGTFRDVILAYSTEGEVIQRFSEIEKALGENPDQLLTECEAHLAYTGNNYYPFLWRFYRSHRAILFQILKQVKLRSTTQDKSIETSIQFLVDHQGSRKDWLDAVKTEDNQKVQLLDLDWIPQKWWQLITNQKTKKSYPDTINRRYFEMCVFSQVMWELKSGDLYVEDSDAFADYRTQQISWAEYEANIDEFGKLVELPVEPKAFVAHVKNWLLDIIQETDRSFPNNQSVRLEQGRPVLKRPKKKVDPKKLAQIESLIEDRIKPVNLLDILTDTELWLNWTQYFRLLSGHDSKIQDSVSRYLAATFCYGCNLGSSQTANSLSNFDRKQIAYVNQRHIGLPSLEKAIYRIINAYNRFSLPKFWGTGKRVSADGTKWDIYEQNLLAEYHIRYGGYGGIGYYHVSDTYIALFSHFIPCGVWEAVYILDGLLKNTSDIQPDTIHADTQGQSTPVFALAYLLGIKLMPRIRNWQYLTLCRPDKQVRYDHIDELFTDVIDWKLIETHLPDMMRVILSIKAGKFTASTILRKLGTYSRKNRLYQAFSELGRAIRTGFLMEYLSSQELRQTIQGALNKSEAFNGFTKWVGFGNAGMIQQNSREEQRKIIKYNHLVSNCLIFYNVFEISRILQEYIQAGNTIEKEIIGSLSPYLTKHINRFGSYSLDLNRKPPALDFDFSLIPS